jgi:predicted O-methyltransferase YrrM
MDHRRDLQRVRYTGAYVVTFRCADRPKPISLNCSMQPTRFSAIFGAPVWMTFPERVVLYSTVFGTRPRRTLEIGTYRGGSSVIIVAALDDVGAGELVCVDPVPQIAADTWRRIKHRATVIEGSSPGALENLAPTPEDRFQLVLIDGDHSLEGVLRDVEGVLPLVDDEAVLLFHDAHFSKVDEGLRRVLAIHADRLIDCGLVSNLATPDDASPGVTWGGLRQLRFVRPASERLLA